MSRRLARGWWEKAERLAGLEPKRGRGWHSLRRKFASDLMHKPLKVLSELGGWKNPQTILICYQHPDQEQLREALLDGLGAWLRNENRSPVPRAGIRPLGSCQAAQIPIIVCLSQHLPSQRPHLAFVPVSGWPFHPLACST